MANALENILGGAARGVSNVAGSIYHGLFPGLQRQIEDERANQAIGRESGRLENDQRALLLEAVNAIKSASPEERPGLIEQYGAVLNPGAFGESAAPISPYQESDLKGKRTRDFLSAAGGTSTPGGRALASMVTGLPEDLLVPDARTMSAIQARAVQEMAQRRGMTDSEFLSTPEGRALGEIGSTRITTNVDARPASAAERKDFVSTKDFGNKLRELQSSFDPSFVGPAEGRFKQWAEKWLPGAVTEEGITFRQITNMLGDDLLRLKSGAQINEQEYQRLRKFLPTPDLPDKTFKARLGQFVKMWDELLAMKREGMEVSGVVVPEKKAGVTLVGPNGQRYEGVDPDEAKSAPEGWRVER